MASTQPSAIDQVLAPTPFTPQPLPAATAGGLVGFLNLYCLPVEYLLADPATDGSTILGNLQLAPNTGWYELKVTQNTIKFDETPKAARGVTTYATKVNATRAQNGDEGAAIWALQGRRCLVMLRDMAGRLRLVGSRESFLVFRSGSEGSSPSARAGIDLQFTGELSRPAVYYAGALPLVGGGVLSGSTGAATGTGSVTVKNRKGELMATVQAGQTIIIKSGFRVALQIQ
ncbi:hypothetical protein [Hymenobacter psychrotolerans]|uniref:hypothetical protein n=1 Tax=Hymenobacter psychrotolerans TaxID=344998 RepID=UPI001114E7DD|nr:hypothetical protein [Hymenobacter psychrotolerans]